MLWAWKPLDYDVRTKDTQQFVKTLTIPDDFAPPPAAEDGKGGGNGNGSSGGGGGGGGGGQQQQRRQRHQSAFHTGHELHSSRFRLLAHQLRLLQR